MTFGEITQILLQYTVQEGWNSLDDGYPAAIRGFQDAFDNLVAITGESRDGQGLVMQMDRAKMGNSTSAQNKFLKWICSLFASSTSNADKTRPVFS